MSHELDMAGERKVEIFVQLEWLVEDYRSAQFYCRNINLNICNRLTKNQRPYSTRCLGIVAPENMLSDCTLSSLPLHLLHQGYSKSCCRNLLIIFAEALSLWAQNDSWLMYAPCVAATYTHPNVESGPLICHPSSSNENRCCQNKRMFLVIFQR